MKPLPMLATKAAPFDAEDYLFEVKWDGVRALAAVEHHSWSLWGRHGVDYTARYPELAVLRRLPRGTVVDGELVTLDQGRADQRVELSISRIEQTAASLSVRRRGCNRLPSGWALAHVRVVRP